MRGIWLVAVVGLVLSFASFVVNSVRTTCVSELLSFSFFIEDFRGKSVRSEGVRIWLVRVWLNGTTDCPYFSLN